MLKPENSVYRIYENKSDRNRVDQKNRTYQVGVLGGVGIKIGLKGDSYLLAKGLYEYRMPLIQTGYVLDNHWVNGVSANIGYGFKLR